VRRQRRRRSELRIFSLAFLDCICCGFGAIVLLLVLTKVGEPQALEQTVEDLDGQVAKLERELFEIRGESRVLDRSLRSRQEQVSEERSLVARLRGDLSSIEGQFAATRQTSQVQDIVTQRLLAAQQALNEEMKRLQEQAGAYRRPVDAPVGGIPVDSEYVIFVIDTSGSMQQWAWTAVQKKMAQVLDAYPKVKGMQVMSDMGQYMFSQYAGKWIPDTAVRRRLILQQLAGWSPFSNSSPVEGIERAIRTFAVGDKKISLYVFGDEFTGDSIDEVLKTVDGLNRRDAKGHRRVRIHAVGFPTTFAAGSEHTGVRFATLMRALCADNDGTYVGLADLR
jgi:hypothetical protein